MPRKLPFLPDEHHYAIARVAISAAQLDHAIERLIYLLLALPDQVAEFILRNINTNRLIELLQTIFLCGVPEEESDIKALFQRIKVARQDRNDILHWFYEESSIAGSAKLSDKRPFRKKPAREMTAKDVEAVADSLDQCQGELVEWMAYYDWRKELSLHDVPAEQSDPPYWAIPAKFRPLGK